jgi:DNA repair exonuclease SbcCD ATPase subunit
MTRLVSTVVPDRSMLRLMIFILALTTSAVGRAQQPDMASQPMVAEMQRLRQAVERNAIAILATHRAAMQQQRVDALTGQEFYVRQQIASAAADQAKAESIIRALQSRIAQNPDPNSPLHAQAQDALMAARSDADRAASLIQQYRNWQAELTASLRSEQSKLNDLLDRLNGIETELQAMPAGRQGR